MTQESKLKILTYAVIFLMTLNLATIGTILWHIRQTTPNEQTQYSAPQSIQQDTNYRPTFRRGRALPFAKIVRELNLSQEQYQKFVAEHRKFISKIRPLIQELHFYREKIDQELAKPNPSLTKIRRYSHKIGKIHEQLSIEQSKYYIALAKLCTPEQRQKLYEIYRKQQTTPGKKRWKKQ